MHVLLVDDDPGILLSIRRALEFEGYRVTTAADGVAALEAVEREAPDGLVLDVTMPRLDGLGVCRELRARGDRTPVLVLTARHAVADRVAGLDAGADDYLTKPFEMAELLARVEARLRRDAPVKAETPSSPDVVAVGDVRVDLARSEVSMTRGRRETSIMFAPKASRSSGSPAVRRRSTRHRGSPWWCWTWGCRTWTASRCAAGCGNGPRLRS